MPPQIPARQRSSVRKYSVDTDPRLRRIKQEFRLSAFLQYCVVVLHYDRAVRIPVRRHTKAEHGIVRSEGKQTCPCNGEHCRKEDSPQSSSEVWRGKRAHEDCIIARKIVRISSVSPVPSVVSWFPCPLIPISPLTIPPPTGKLPHSPEDASGERLGGWCRGKADPPALYSVLRFAHGHDRATGLLHDGLLIADH